jgi:hypothetical protein
MKSLFWIILVLFVPLSAAAQSRLFFHATIDLPMHGWCGDVSHGCNEGGALINDTMEVELNEFFPLIAGENLGMLKSPIVDWNWGGPYVYSGNYTFQYDPQSHTLYNLQITVAGLNGSSDDSSEINFAISLDSISLGVVSDSNWTLAYNDVPCSYSSSYYYQYLMYNSAEGVDQAIGQGQTTLVNLNVSTASVEVSTGGPSSNIQITYLGNGAVQIECSPSSPEEAVEIFDALGHLTLRATMDGNFAQISNLPLGCYFARIGDQVAKFIVLPR